MAHERQNWQSNRDAGFVPTMGYLHEGHITLVEQARRENKQVIVSIFVNPTQFGPYEDLERYPTKLEDDLKLLEEVGVDVVFTPVAKEIYPEGFASYIDITGPVTTEGEGEHRPGHFRGVATIVMKLLQIVQPGRAYFGQKDAQQVAVIKRMVSDFNLPVELRIQPTIREADGLALSSRNSYLNAEQRRQATILYQALKAGKKVFHEHPGGDPQIVRKAMQETIETQPEARIIYSELRNPESFKLLETLRGPALLLLAVQVGPARLIDNFLLQADGSWEIGSIHASKKDLHHAR